MTYKRLIVTGLVLIAAAACSKSPEEPAASKAPQPAAKAAAPEPAPARHAPLAVETVVLGPFTGFDAPLHPDNMQPEPVEYYGTDLGWSYSHDGTIHFLFGDTHKDEAGEGIDPLQNDTFGTIELSDWPDPSVIGPGNVPRIRMGQIPGSNKLMPIDTGQTMEGLKTPNGGFSSGQREFGTFITGKPQACRTDNQCPAGLSCDIELGFFGSPPGTDEGLTLPCARGWAGCSSHALTDADGNPDPDSGFCVDKGSSMAADSEYGRAVIAAMEILIAVRDEKDPGKYEVFHRWMTNRFLNPASRPVADFVPERGAGRARQDYRNLHGEGANPRVFLWGRPWFNGVNAKGQTLAMYFAYADMPTGPDFEWKLRYYTGSAADGTPQFSDNETDAAAVDLDASKPGIQPEEIHDWVQHMSVVWFEELGKWVMFYGGGISKAPNERFGLGKCGIAEVFARTECEHVPIGDGPLLMRTADDPWGPWTPPQILIVGGDPEKIPPEEQFGPGGVFYHPACEGEACQARSLQFPEHDYGWFYGANIIEEWTVPTANGVDVLWLASTWQPYRVIMLRTRINK